jgi:RNA polymerase sigma factor (sigma-70 family)
VQWVEAFNESLVLTVLRRMRLPEADAQDAAQTVWLRALRYADRRGGFDHIGSPKKWLARLARNTGKDFYRRQARGPRRFGERVGDIDTLPLADRRGDVFERIACEEVLAVFDRTAPERVRAVFVLVCRQGWTVTETADRLAVGTRTVRRRLREARTRLFKLMGLPVPTPRSRVAMYSGEADRGYRPCPSGPGSARKKC